MNNIYIDQMKSCADIEDMEERTKKSFEILRAAANDNNISDKQFDNLRKVRAEVLRK